MSRCPLAGRALSTLGLLYIMQAMPPQWRLKGMILGIGIPQLATPLARLFSSDLLERGQWTMLYIFELGLALISLALIFLLRLPPSEKMKRLLSGRVGSIVSSGTGEKS